MSNAFKTNDIPMDTGNWHLPEQKAVPGLRHLLLTKCGEYFRSRGGQPHEEKTSLLAVHSLLHLISLSYLINTFRPNRLMVRQDSGLLFGSYLVRISARTLAIRIEEFCGFLQALQANIRAEPLLSQDRFLPIPVLFT
jgi:hypothetical protein